MTKPTFQNDKKKYISFLMYLDDASASKIDKSMIKTKEGTAEYIDQSYPGSHSHEESRKKHCMRNPNLYKDAMFILLEEELMRKYSTNKLLHKRSTIKFDELLLSKPEPKKIRTKITIDVEIETLEDLIRLIDTYPLKDDIEYDINMESLHKIKPYLHRLQNMIGMKSLKKNILDQLLYYIQDLHLGGKGTSRGDYLHTVIYGPPGTGKTHVAKIIGKIFSKLGILKKGIFKKVTRSDLIAGYLGQTALKTRDVIQECLDGVLFIDEAYSLGNSEKRDSFSKECIDTLCEALSNYKENLMVIVAGYETELNECFFNFNKGLDSRFTWRFKIDDYTGSDLHKIFLKKIYDYGWKSDDSIKEEWFSKKISYFTFFGRDMEVLFSKTKIAHSRRVFCKSLDEKKIITMKDLEKAFQTFIDNDEVKKRKENESHKNMINTIYI